MVEKDPELEKKLTETRRNHAKSKHAKLEIAFQQKLKELHQNNPDQYVIIPSSFDIPEDIKSELAWGWFASFDKLVYYIGLPFVGELPRDDWGRHSRPFLKVFCERAGISRLTFVDEESAKDLVFALNVARYNRKCTEGMCVGIKSV